MTGQPNEEDTANAKAWSKELLDKINFDIEAGYFDGLCRKLGVQ